MDYQSQSSSQVECRWAGIHMINPPFEKRRERRKERGRNERRVSNTFSVRWSTDEHDCKAERDDVRDGR